MSANVEQMMYNNKNGKPWHKEGNAVDGLSTSAEAIGKAGLDWRAELKPLQTEGGIEVPQSKAVVRSTDNKVLGVVGNRYRPLQNKEAFGFFDEIVGAEQAIYETAGSLNGGKKVWLLAKMPDFIQVGGGDDVIEKYVLLSNSHDGSSPVHVLTTPVRVVCSNTLNLALSRKNSRRMSVRHTESMNERMKEAEKILGLVNNIYSQVDSIFNEMANKQLNTKQMENYFVDVFGRDEEGKPTTTTENLIWHNPDVEGSGIISKLIDEGAGSDIKGVRGSVWGAYNVMTEFFDHHKGYSKNTEQLDAIWYGSGATKKEKAYKEAVKLLS